MLFVAGIFIPFCWVVCAFLPICARRGAKGPRDAMNVRRAAIASAVGFCVYVVSGWGGWWGKEGVGLEV